MEHIATQLLRSCLRRVRQALLQLSWTISTLTWWLQFELAKLVVKTVVPTWMMGKFNIDSSLVAKKPELAKLLCEVKA